MSGGGSRAANFSLAVMEQLENLGFMRHVTAISSTSGGGLAGAYYSLKGPEIDWKSARTLMSTDFLSKWVFSNLRPDNLISTSLTHKDRSDLMADIFDDVLFSNATYSSFDLPPIPVPLILPNCGLMLLH
jgi:NTE family protein